MYVENWKMTFIYSCPFTHENEGRGPNTEQTPPWKGPLSPSWGWQCCNEKASSNTGCCCAPVLRMRGLPVPLHLWRSSSVPKSNPQAPSIYRMVRYQICLGDFNPSQYESPWGPLASTRDIIKRIWLNIKEMPKTTIYTYKVVPIFS